MTPSPEVRRGRVVRGGPLIVEGPVEIDDGDRTIVCDRFQVALCMCGRSRIAPLCDTSHRRRRRQR